MSAGYQRPQDPRAASSSLTIFERIDIGAANGSEAVDSAHPPVSLARGRVEPAPKEIFREDDTLAKLLRAVESANLSFSMQSTDAHATEVVECEPAQPLECPASADEPPAEVSEPLPFKRNLEAIPPPVLLRGREPVAVPDPFAAWPAQTQDTRSVDLKDLPWISSSSRGLIPLLSASEGIHLHEGMENPSLCLGPPSLAEGEGINWALDEPLFKPPAPVEDEQMPGRIEGRRKNRAPRMVASLVGRLGGSMAWLVDEPAEEPKEELRDPRQRERLVNPPLIAHYWTGGPPRAHKIADLSSTGLYLVTNDRWRPGTRILITLQRTDEERNPRDRGLAVEFMILRWGRDGLGGVFIPAIPGSIFNPAGVNLVGASKAALDAFVQRLQERRQELPGAGLPKLPFTATAE